MPASFIDTNIFMYAIGGDHPHKNPSQKIVEQVVDGELEGVINTEVLQEILYRYGAIGKPKIGFKLFDTLVNTFSTIWPIEREDLIQARKLQETQGIKIRDAIHAATMNQHHVTTIYSFDTDFDRIPFLKRITPGADHS